MVEVERTGRADEAQIERWVRLQAYLDLIWERMGLAAQDPAQRRGPQVARWPAWFVRAAREAASGGMVPPGLTAQLGFHSFRRKERQGRAAPHTFDSMVLA